VDSHETRSFCPASHFRT